LWPLSFFFTALWHLFFIFTMLSFCRFWSKGRVWWTEDCYEKLWFLLSLWWRRYPSRCKFSFLLYKLCNILLLVFHNSVARYVALFFYSQPKKCVLTFLWYDIWQSEVHGLAALQGAVCMDSLNRCSGILYFFVVVVKDSRNYRYPDFFFL
jgi:hypothetical protein